MRVRRTLLWMCAATLALGACSARDSGGQLGEDSTRSSAGASERDGRPDREREEPAHFSLSFGPGMAPAKRETVRAFVAFAADPSASTGTEVPLASPLLLRVNDVGSRVRSRDLQDPSSWFVSDGEGTTSALFVIENSIARSQDRKVRFSASTRPLPLCAQAENGDKDAQGESVYVTLQPRSGCAEGFRIRLVLDPSAAIRAAELSVRAP